MKSSTASEPHHLSMSANWAPTKGECAAAASGSERNQARCSPGLRRPIWNRTKCNNGVHQDALNAISAVPSWLRGSGGSQAAEQVHQRYAGWLAQQSQAGVTFSAVEQWWLDKMVEVIAVSAGISPDDLDNAPFTERGGVDGAICDLGPSAATIIDQLNTNLTA
jgi:hypothetical protein